MVDARRRAVSALVYPAVLIGLSIAMILVLTFFVVPKFSAFFQGMDDLPLVTRIVLGVAACSDQASTPQPDTGPDARPASPTELPQARLDRLERLARRTARALRYPAFR